MIRFVIRRLLQMIPTVVGVMLITFLLFNLVGGSPGTMMLGEKASAAELEAFDEQRGFNRPLFWGYTSATRLYTQTDFSRSAGPWASVPGADWAAGQGVRLTGPAEIPVPLAFKPPPGRKFRWTLTGTANGDVLLRSDDQVISFGAFSAVETVVWDGGNQPVFLLPPDGSLTLLALSCHRLHERPWQSQWSYYAGQMLRLDFGHSHAVNQPVLTLLRQGIGPTLMLAVPILAGETLVSLLLALACAYYRNRIVDRMILVVCVMLMSVNYLVWIVAGQYWLGYRAGWFPVWGFESWAYVLLPVIIGIMHGLGSNVRFYRTVMLEEMHKDYVRTAKAKGCGPSAILFRHVLRNALIPVITNVALSLPFLYTGSLLLETFFGIPGLGYISINAINSADVDVVRAVVLIGSLLYLLANLLADIAYAWADPRVTLS